MGSGNADEKGFLVNPNTNESDIIDTSVDPIVEPQSILRQISNAMKDKEGIVVTPDDAQQARKELEDKEKE